MKKLIIILFVPIIIFSQKSIDKNDIEISTQLTLLTVEQNDVTEFKKHMKALSKLAKDIKLEEDYDWLLYKSDKSEYLLINFSNGIHDILTLSDYKEEFHRNKTDKEFDKIISSISKLDISVKNNYIKEMLLPWSTVEQISVSEFPLATMEEYLLSMDKIDQLDTEIRKLVGILKETDYPYPLEGNRGSVGAYGTITLVWFYDDFDKFYGSNSLYNWMARNNKKKELQSILNNINGIAESRKTYKLTYKKELSY